MRTFAVSITSNDERRMWRLCCRWTRWWTSESWWTDWSSKHSRGAKRESMNSGCCHRRCRGGCIRRNVSPLALFGHVNSLLDHVTRNLTFQSTKSCRNLEGHMELLNIAPHNRRSFVPFATTTGIWIGKRSKSSTRSCTRGLGSALRQSSF